MKQYELLVVLPGTMEASALPTTIAEVKAIVEKHGGQNIVMQDRGKSRLAYPIRHIRYGYFHIIRFNGEGDAIQSMQKELSLKRELLRSLISAYDPTRREHTQKKLGRTEDGPMRTLASVFERFGGEVKKTDAPAPAPVAPKTHTPETKTAPAAPAEDKQEGEKPAVPMEDIDKKLDQLLEDDLKQV